MLGLTFAPFVWFTSSHIGRAADAPPYAPGSIPIDSLLTACTGCSTGGLVPEGRISDAFVWSGHIIPGTKDDRELPFGIALFEWAPDANASTPAIPPGLSKRPTAGEVFATPLARRWLAMHPAELAALTNPAAGLTDEAPVQHSPLILGRLDPNQLGGPDVAAILVAGGVDTTSGADTGPNSALGTFSTRWMSMGFGFRKAGPPRQPRAVLLNFGDVAAAIATVASVVFIVPILAIAAAVVALVAGVTEIGRRRRAARLAELQALGASQSTINRLAIIDGATIGAAGYITMALTTPLVTKVLDHASGTVQNSRLGPAIAILWFMIALCAATETIFTRRSLRYADPLGDLSTSARRTMFAVSAAVVLVAINVLGTNTGSTNRARLVVLAALVVGSVIAVGSTGRFVTTWIRRTAGDATVVSLRLLRSKVDHHDALCLLGAISCGLILWSAISPGATPTTDDRSVMASEVGGGSAEPPIRTPIANNATTQPPPIVIEWRAIGRLSAVADVEHALSSIEGIRSFTVTAAGSVGLNALSGLTDSGAPGSGAPEATDPPAADAPGFDSGASNATFPANAPTAPTSSSTSLPASDPASALTDLIERIELELVAAPTDSPPNSIVAAGSSPAAGTAFLADPHVIPFAAGSAKGRPLLPISGGTSYIDIRNLRGPVQIDGADLSQPHTALEITDVAQLRTLLELEPLAQVNIAAPPPTSAGAGTAAETFVIASPDATERDGQISPLVIVNSNEADRLKSARARRAIIFPASPTDELTIRRTLALLGQRESRIDLSLGATQPVLAEYSWKLTSAWKTGGEARWAPAVALTMLIASAVIAAMRVRSDYFARTVEISQLRAMGASRRQLRVHLAASAFAPWLGGFLLTIPTCVLALVWARSSLDIEFELAPMVWFAGGVVAILCAVVIAASVSIGGESGAPPRASE